MPTFPLTVEIPDSDPEYEVVSFSVDPAETPPTTQENPVQWTVPDGRIVLGVHIFATATGNPPLYLGHFEADYGIQLSSDFSRIEHLLFVRDVLADYHVVITTIAG